MHDQLVIYIFRAACVVALTIPVSINYSIWRSHCRVENFKYICLGFGGMKWKCIYWELTRSELRISIDWCYVCDAVNSPKDFLLFSSKGKRFRFFLFSFRTKFFLMRVSEEVGDIKFMFRISRSPKLFENKENFWKEEIQNEEYQNERVDVYCMWPMLHGEPSEMMFALTTDIEAFPKNYVPCPHVKCISHQYFSHTRSDDSLEPFLFEIFRQTIQRTCLE